jgi:chemotaxis protein MotA
MSSPLLGIIIGFAALIGTMILEGSNPASFVQISALMIILVGSLSATLTSFDLKTIRNLPKFFGFAFSPPKIDLGATITQFYEFSIKSRREGLLSLEDEVEDIEDEVMRIGMRMVIDGADTEILEDTMDQLVLADEKAKKEAQEVFETFGGFSPTMGIVGTVMGLVHVLEGLGSGNLEALGEGIAVAFIATFYGIGLANLVWIPLSNRVRFLIGNLRINREIMVDGMRSVQNGMSPEMVKERMIAHVPEAEERAHLRKSMAAD